MGYETLTLEKAAGIATLTLNRPEKLNALNAKMATELMDALDNVDADNDVGVVVITGAGRAFCAGADLDRFHRLAEARKSGQPINEEMLTTVMGRGPAMMQEMAKPIIAMINGPAVGFGLTLACACDIRIAAEEAVLGAIFARVGLLPEYGSTFNLTRLIGIAKACELVFTGKIIKAQEAKEIGLVNQITPASELKATVIQMATTIAQGPPIAIKLAKRGLYQGLETSLRTQIQWEILAINEAFRTEDHAEGVRAFLEKRKPVFRGK